MDDSSENRSESNVVDSATISGDNAVAAAAAATTTTNKKAVKPVAPFFSSSKSDASSEQSGGKLQATVNPQPSETVPLDLSASKGALPLDLSVRKKEEMEEKNVIDRPMGRHLNLPTIALSRPNTAGKMTAPSRIMSKPLAPSSRIGVKTGTLVHKVSPMRHGLPTTTTALPHTTVLQPKPQGPGSSSVGDEPSVTALSTAPASKSNFAVRFIASFEKRAAAGAGTKRTASPVLAPLKCGFPLLAKASEQRTNSNDNTATPLSVVPTATPSDENCLSEKRLTPSATEECKLQEQCAKETIASNIKVEKVADLEVVTKPTETSVSDASSATKRSDSTPKADESKSITDARRVSCDSPSTTPQKRLDIDGKKKKTTSKASRSKQPSVSCSDEEEPKVEVKKGKKVKKEPEEDESDKELEGEGDEENNDNESNDKKQKPEVRVTRSRNSSPKQAQSPLKKTKKNGSASKHRPPAGRKSKSCAKNETGSSGDEQTVNTTVKTSKRRRTSNNNNVTSRRGQARSASSQDESDASESGVTTRSQCAQNAPKRQSPKKRRSTPSRRNNKQKKKEASSSESEPEDEDNVSNRTRARKTSKTADKSPKKNISCSKRGTNAATNDSPAKKKRKQKEASRADSEDDDEGEISSTNASESSPPAKRLRSNANKRESEAVTSSDSEESEAETQRLTRRMTRKKEQTEKNREDDDEDGEGDDSDCSRTSPPHTRGRKRRSLLDELHTSEGYVGDETRSKSCDDLYADPSKLGREERALQRAFMQLFEMNGSSSSAGNQKKCSRTPSTGSNKRSVERHQPEAATVQSPSKTKKTTASPEKRNEEEKEAKKKRKKKKRKKKVKRLRQSTRLKSRVARGIFAEDSSSDSFVEQDDEDDEDVVMDIKESSSSNSSDEESDEEGTSETSESEENNKRRRQPMLRELRALFPDEIPTRVRSSESRDDTSITSAATVSTPRPKKRGRPAASNSRSNTPDTRRMKFGKLPTKSARLACSSPSSSHRSETATVTNVASAIPIEIKKLGSLRREAGETPLHKAARKGNEEVVKFCLESDYGDVNARDNAGFTPLHESCLQGFVNITAMLLRHGADVNVASLDGLRPLRDAIESDKVEIVRLLLAYGADLSLLTYSGNDLLDLTQSERMKKLLNGYLRDAYVESNDSALTQQMAKQYAVVLHPKQHGGERVKLKKQRYEKDKKIRKEENEVVRKWHERVRRREETERRRKERKKKKGKDEEESDDEESEEDDWWETDIGQAWTFAGPSSLLDEEAEEGSLNVLDKCPASIDKSDDVIFEFSREPHLNTYHVTVNGVADNYVLLSDVMSNLGVGKQVEEEEEEFIKLHYSLVTKPMTYKEFVDNVDSRNTVLPPPLPTSTPCSKTKKSNSTITLIKINDALRSIMSIESIVVKAPTTIGNRSRRISTISTQKTVDVKRKKIQRQSTTSTTQFSTDSKSDTDRWVDKHFSFAKPAPKITKESPAPSTAPTAASAFKSVPSPAPFNSVKAPPKQAPTAVSIQSKVTPHSFPLPPTSAMLPPRQAPAVVTTTAQFWAAPAPQAPPPPYNTHSLEMYRRNLQSPTPSLGWKSGVASNSAAPWDGGLFNSLSQTSHKTSVPNENPSVEPLPAHRSSSAHGHHHHHHVSYFPPPPLNGHSTFMGAPPQGAHSSLVTQPAPPPYSALGTSRNVLSAVDPLAAAAAAAAYRTHHDLLPGRIGPTGYGLENAFASCIPPYGAAPTFTSGRSTPFQPHYAYRPQY